MEAKSIKLRLADPEDAEFILSLRTDPTKNRYLSPVGSDIETQRQWLRAYKARELAGSEFYFIIEALPQSTPCGVVRVYGIENDTFTWGSWITTHDAPRKTAIESACLIYSFAFEKLGLSRCYFEVRRENSRVLAFHDRFGAQRTTADDLNQYFDYSRDVWLAHKSAFAEFMES